MQLYPYLHFDGQCEAAFKFYEKCLSGKITFMIPHEGSPVADTVPAEWGKKILHATLNVGDDVLQGADSPPNHYQKPQGFSVSISMKDPAEADRVFHALAQDGTVQMPIQENILGCPVWYGHRSVWHPVDDQLRQAYVNFFPAWLM